MPVTQVRQLYANFPEGHPLWVGNLAGGNLNSLPYPNGVDVVINVGNKFQHNGANPIVPRGPKFIDMRIDHWSMGNVMLTEVPLVADGGGGQGDHRLDQSESRRARRRGEEVLRHGADAARPDRQQPGLGPGADHCRSPDL